MRIVAWTAGILGALLLLREAWIALVPRRQQRRTLFAAAQERARDTGKPLLVVGAPGRGIVQSLTPDYTCGDMCVDPNGCPCLTYIRGKIEDVLAQLPDNSAVVFASDILEMVDDAPLAAHHLDRVSGGDLFVTTIDPTSLTAYVWPGTKRRVIDAPPATPDLVYKPLPWHPEAAPPPGGLPAMPAPVMAVATAHVVEMPNVARLLAAPRDTIPTTAEPA